ncbi:MAG: NosD domain-containing protein, partial [Candidatus Micrarchaeaceae archaeon]
SGSGAYSPNSTPYYGIRISGAKNVTVIGCNVNKLGVNLYASSSSNLNVTSNNFSYAGLANIYINSTKNSSFIRNNLQFADFNSSILLVGNSTNNIFLNNSIVSDNRTGFYINSSKNTFVDNFVANTPISFACGINAIFPISNIGDGNICQDNQGCGFIRCSISNTPGNISHISLAPITINSCGSLDYPGYYNLTGNLNTLYFVNVSELQSQFYPCLNIRASDVLLNCNNFTISNSATAIFSSSQKNIKVENCRFTNSSYGIAFSNVTNGTIENVYGNDSISTISLYNSSDGLIKGVTSVRNGYGFYISGTTNTTFANFNASNNTYGIYLQNSTANAFLNGRAVSNAKIDVYASPNDVNSTSDFMQNTVCTLTNANWAGCELKISPNLAFYPETSCLTINRPGSYKLLANIIQAPSECFNIKTDNVQLNCNGHIISGNGVGPAIVSSGTFNVSVYNCTIQNVPTGVAFSNASDVSVFNSIIYSSNVGVNISNSHVFNITGDTFGQGVSRGLYVSHSNYGNVYGNTYNPGSLGVTALLFINSTLNSIENNSVSNWNIGISLLDSTDNYLENNTVSTGSYNYYCAGNATSLDSENGVINYGTTKHDCPSIAAVSPTGQPNQCTSLPAGTTQVLYSDEVYSAGSTCFNLYANNTILNCNGHTIISSNGGIFAALSGTRGSVLENCYLKGFNRSVVMKDSSSSSIYNLTILQAENSSSPAVSVYNSNNADLSNLNITSNSYGLYVNNLSYGSISNIYSAAKTSYFLNNVYSTSISGVSSANSSQIGMLLTNSTANIFSSGDYLGKTGIECAYSSTGKTANINSGRNTCTINNGCSWLSSSSLC